MPVYEKDGFTCYLPPKDKDGKHYWVPVVVKDKSYLIAFTEGIWTGLALCDPEESVTYSPSMVLSSDRLVDYTSDGRRLSSMTIEELAKYTAERLETAMYAGRHSHEHPDNDVDMSDYFFTVSCGCGNFVAFSDSELIPAENYECDMCGRTIIEYIDKSDEEVMYEGINQSNYEDFVLKIKDEMHRE
jgi:hypothetical protein